MAQNHIVNRPESQCPTIKPQDRRPCNTKQCAHDDLNPAIAVANVTYTQTNPSKKKVNLKIGGQAQVFYGTQVKIKCPVRRFNRLVQFVVVFMNSLIVSQNLVVDSLHGANHENDYLSMRVTSTGRPRSSTWLDT